MRYYPMEHITRDHYYERGVVYEKGKIVWQREGDSCHVDINEEDFPIFRGNVFTHNHPGDSPFSPSDLEMACVCGIKELRLTTMPYLYSLKPRPNTTWDEDTFERIMPRMDEIGRAYGLFDDEYNVQYNIDYFEKEENVQASSFMEKWPLSDIKDWNRVWKKVAKENDLIFKCWPWP